MGKEARKAKKTTENKSQNSFPVVVSLTHFLSTNL